MLLAGLQIISLDDIRADTGARTPGPVITDMVTLSRSSFRLVIEDDVRLIIMF